MLDLRPRQLRALNAAQRIVMRGGAANAGGDYDADWATRSTAAGVVYANALDTLAKIDAGYTNGGNGRRITHDTTTKVLSAGSMRFDLLAGETGSDISGSWVPGGASTGNWGHVFSQNSDMYVQYRCRLSGNMYSNLQTHWKDNVGNTIWPGWKISVLYSATGTPCDAIEATITAANGQINHMYTHCGDRQVRSSLTGPAYYGGTGADFMVQAGWNFAGGTEADAYPNVAYPGEATHFPTDGWFTVYQKVHIVTFGSANSSVEMWIQPPGENRYRKLVACNGYTIFNNPGNNPADGFGRIMLTPYMTGLVTSAPTTSYMWFSELIASTQPIALPLAA